MAAATIPNGMSWAIRALTLLLAGLLAYVLVRLIMGFLNPESLWLTPAPVSYTHLTLPTICSV